MTNKNNINNFYGILHVWKQLHRKLQAISFEKSDLKGNLVFSVLTYNICHT